MSRGTKESSIKRPKPRFMESTEASRASKVRDPTSPCRPGGATTLSSPNYKRQHILQRATQRLTSFSASKVRPSRLSIASPLPGCHSRKSSLVLSNPTLRYSHLPEPVKKVPLDSPTDKPLPNLPVATIVSHSPVQRRSLLDATEKPLRRSISPNTFLDWPTLSPARSRSQQSRRGANMSHQLEPTQSSLNENVIGRVRQLELTDDATSHLNNFRVESTSKCNTQNFTPRVESVRQTTATGNDESTTIAFLSPRPAPVAPQTSEQHRSSSDSGTGQSSFLRGLNNFKTVRGSNVAVPETGLTVEQENRPPSSFIPLFSSTAKASDTNAIASDRRGSSALNGSNIPRLRGVSERGSPLVGSANTSPKVLQLKRARGQISNITYQDTLIAELPGDGHRSLLRENGRIGTQNAGSITTSTKPSSSVPDRTTISSENGEAGSTSMTKALEVDELSECEPSKKSSITTIKQDPLSSGPATPQSPKWKERKSFESLVANEELSPIRAFKFPASPSEDRDVDHSSEMTHAISMSSISGAGTIYGEDENGAFRLKPVSKADPKHGPYVRLQDSADRLILDDEHLAQVDAKRQEYKRKYSPTSGDAHDDEHKVVIELESLLTASAGTQDKVETLNQSSMQDHDDGGSANRKSSVHTITNNGRRLAPPVLTNIPTLTHSPTGWPLEISKITPFAEVNTSRNSSAAAHRMSLSHKNPEVTSGTPARMSLQAVQHSPSSAYTIRTALYKLPSDGPRHEKDRLAKTQKSLPEVITRPVFPPRKSSKMNQMPNSKSQDGGLRKKTSDILKSFTNQRADFKPKLVTRDSNANTTQDSYEHGADTHPLSRETSPFDDGTSPAPIMHMQTYNTMTCHMNPHDNTDRDLPSSPSAIASAVYTGRPVKMKSKLSGLFHKSSRDDILARSGSNTTIIRSPANMASTNPSPILHTVARLNNSSVRRKPVAGTAPPPLLANGVHKPSPLSSPLMRNDSATSARGSAAAIYHGMVKDSSLPTLPAVTLNHKRKFRRSPGHKYNVTHPPAASDTKRDTSPSFLTNALEPLEIRDATDLAFALLDRARGSSEQFAGEEAVDSANMKRHEYVELAKVIVNTVSLARDVEKAMEEARIAATRAEMCSLQTRKAVGELNESVRILTRRRDEMSEEITNEEEE